MNSRVRPTEEISSISESSFVQLDVVLVCLLIRMLHVRATLFYDLGRCITLSFLSRTISWVDNVTICCGLPR